jgi:xylulokinase
MGNIRFEDIPQLIQVDCVLTPDPSNKAIYEELYQTFLEIYQKNRSIFDKLNGIQNILS